MGSRGGYASPASPLMQLGAPRSPAFDPYSGQPHYGISAPQARLIIITQDGTPGESFPIIGGQIDVGRTEGDIRLSVDPYVCPRHARVYRKGSKFALRDLASVNGVFVRITRPVELTDGDLVLVGLQVLRFEAVTGGLQGLGAASERGVEIFGTPAAPRFARLAQKTVEGTSRDIYYLTREQTVLGRESGDIVFTGDAFMSRRHAELTRTTVPGRFLLRDLESSNGTYVAVKGECELTSGDHIRIGQHLFRLEF